MSNSMEWKVFEVSEKRLNVGAGACATAQNSGSLDQPKFYTRYKRCSELLSISNMSTGNSSPAKREQEGVEGGMWALAASHNGDEYV